MGQDPTPDPEIPLREKWNFEMSLLISENASSKLKIRFIAFLYALARSNNKKVRGLKNVSISTEKESIDPGQARTICFLTLQTHLYIRVKSTLKFTWTFPALAPSKKSKEQIAKPYATFFSVSVRRTQCNRFNFTSIDALSLYTSEYVEDSIAWNLDKGDDFLVRIASEFLTSMKRSLFKLIYRHFWALLSRSNAFLKTCHVSLSRFTMTTSLTSLYPPQDER